jgi:hypothetical protein
MKIWQNMKRIIEKYDAWCESLGLTPEQKRSCVPYKKDPAPESDQENTA